jgi:hypothetical protein
MTNAARMIRLACCALVVIAGVTAKADAKKKKQAPAKPAIASTVDPAVAVGRDRPGVATFTALPKLPPVSDPAAQTSGTTAANQAQIKRQQAYEAAEQARQAKVAADMAAYEKQEAAYRQRMDAWNKQVAACKAGDTSQCAATGATGATQ